MFSLLGLEMPFDVALTSHWHTVSMVRSQRRTSQADQPCFTEVRMPPTDCSSSPDFRNNEMREPVNILEIPPFGRRLMTTLRSCWGWMECFGVRLDLGTPPYRSSLLFSPLNTDLWGGVPLYNPGTLHPLLHPHERCRSEAL